MFSVEYLHQNVDAIKPIASGVSFGFFEKPLFFKIHADVITSDLILSFTVQRQKVNIANFNIGKIEDNKMNILYSVPENFINSGMSSPVSILVASPKLLAIMFRITKINDSAFKFEYEFYDGNLPPTEIKK